MATSGNPAKRAATEKAAALKITSADSWLAEADGRVVELPSGKVVRIIMPGMQAFLKNDLIPNELMPIMLKAMNGEEAGDLGDIRSLTQSTESLLQLADTMDAIFVYCVTEPQFKLAPASREERVAGTLYIDMVDMDDKSFVFQCAVGGTRDLETFREKQAASMAQLQLS